jgi:phosphoglycerate dehydrogenase-like enzyme
MNRPALAFAMAADRTKHVFEPQLIERLSASCDILDMQPLENLVDARARDLLRHTDILVTGWGCDQITAQVIAAAPRLRLIAHAAGTVKFIIAPEVYEAGIVVTHAADANAVPVAEFTVAAILFSNKRAFEMRDLYRREPSRLSSYALMDEPIGNYRRTIGLVGASRIGRKVAKLLENFDFDVLLYDPYVQPEDAITRTVELVSLPELMRRSDVVSVHAPSLPSTHHMIGKSELALMRDGATLINTARGALVNEDDLLAELESSRIHAVIDVTEPEIPAPSSPFFHLPNVFLTPHIAGAVGTERTRLGRQVAEEIERFVSGKPLKFAIEPAALERLA